MFFFSGHVKFGEGKYFQVCDFFWQKSLEAAQNGGYFPIITICLGAQWMVDWILGTGLENFWKSIIVNCQLWDLICNILSTRKVKEYADRNGIALKQDWEKWSKLRSSVTAVRKIGGNKNKLAKIQKVKMA